MGTLALSHITDPLPGSQSPRAPQHCPFSIRTQKGEGREIKNKGNGTNPGNSCGRQEVSPERERKQKEWGGHFCSFSPHATVPGSLPCCSHPSAPYRQAHSSKEPPRKPHSPALALGCKEETEGQGSGHRLAPSQAGLWLGRVMILLTRN